MVENGYMLSTPVWSGETICVHSSDGKGRGVFAKRHFAAGDLIERVPVIVVPASQVEHVEQTTLDNYCYGWGDGLAIALGYASLYNHSYKPNAIYVKKFEEQSIEIVAIRDIEAGAEVLVNYNGNPEDQAPVWFDVVP